MIICPDFITSKNPITSTSRDTIKWIEENPDLQSLSTVFRSSVEKITKEDSCFKLQFTQKKETKSIEAKYIILATGLMDVQPTIQGSIEPILPYGNRNEVLYCIRCDGHRVIGHHVSVLGTNTDTIYIGALIKERYGNDKISILTNGVELKMNDKTSQLARAYKMNIYSSPILEVVGKPKAEGLEGYRLEDGQFIDSTRSIVSLGTIVYNQLIKPFNPEMAEDGRLIVNDKFETSEPNIFAVGDLVYGRKTTDLYRVGRSCRCSR